MTWPNRTWPERKWPERKWPERKWRDRALIAWLLMSLIGGASHFGQAQTPLKQDSRDHAPDKQNWAAPRLKPNFETPPQRITLIEGLMEISGLARGPGTTLYAHNDEHAIIYQLDSATGKMIAAFALGNPTLDKDFEGIAAYDNRIYLLTSRGKLYEALIGPHKSRVKYNAYDTGLGDICETEGLSRGPQTPDGRPTFLLLCKAPHQPELKKRVLIYQWSLTDRLPVTEPWINIARKDLALGAPKHFKPSAIEWSDTHQQIFILSGKNAQFAAIRPDGTVLQRARLPQKYHPQAEGLTLDENGGFIIADEGQGSNAGTLSLYPALSSP